MKLDFEIKSKEDIKAFGKAIAVATLELCQEYGHIAVEVYAQIPLMIGANIHKMGFKDVYSLSVYDALYQHIDSQCKAFESMKDEWGKMSKEEFFKQLLVERAYLIKDGQDYFVGGGFEDFMKKREQ